MPNMCGKNQSQTEISIGYARWFTNLITPVGKYLLSGIDKELGGEPNEKTIINYFGNYNSLLYGNNCFCRKDTKL